MNRMEEFQLVVLTHLKETTNQWCSTLLCPPFEPFLTEMFQEVFWGFFFLSRSLSDFTFLIFTTAYLFFFFYFKFKVSFLRFHATIESKVRGLANRTLDLCSSLATQFQSLVDGTRKNEVCSMWLDLIEKAADSFLISQVLQSLTFIFIPQIFGRKKKK